MAYMIRMNRYLRVKEEKEYPWPCERFPDRTIKLFPKDVLARHCDGTITTISGIGKIGIIVPDEDPVEIEEPIKLVIGS